MQKNAENDNYYENKNNALFAKNESCKVMQNIKTNDHENSNKFRSCT